jgi:hypothetical protein
MRLSAQPGAHGSRKQPERAPSEVAASKGKRAGNRGRGSVSAVQRRALESAVRERHEIRNERNPLARRHMPLAEQHIAPDELPGKDRTRAHRVAAVTLDVDTAYRLKRGEAR